MAPRRDDASGRGCVRTLRMRWDRVESAVATLIDRGTVSVIDRKLSVSPTFRGAS